MYDKGLAERLTGRPMKGWMMVKHDGIAEDADLQRYVDLAVFFTGSLPPKAKTKKPRRSRKAK